MYKYIIIQGGLENMPIILPFIILWYLIGQWENAPEYVLVTHKAITIEILLHKTARTILKAALWTNFPPKKRIPFYLPAGYKGMTQMEHLPSFWWK